MGHVNNAVYFTYFEMARAGYMKAVSGSEPTAGALVDLFPFILLKVGCQFLVPAVLGDVLVIHGRVPRIGTKSFELEYLVIRKSDSRPVAIGNSTLVHFDYSQQKTGAIPDALRQQIEEFERGTLHES